MATPSKKKQTVSQKYNRAEYSQIWNGITQSHLDAFHAFCKNCRSDFTISHGGKFDKTNKHRLATKSQS